MDKQLIFAVAGSGKTQKIIGELNEHKRSLVVTYTNDNLNNLRQSVLRKFGCMPSNITIITYFSFLYSFCFRPFFSYKLKDNCFTWDTPNTFPVAPNIKHYMNTNRYLYANRTAKYILENNGVEKIKTRLEKYFDNWFIDEVQDFGGNDFNLLMEIAKSSLDMTFVGDFYQHTYDTSRDSKINQNLHKNGIEEYRKRFKKIGFGVGDKSLNKSHRCSQSVCDFITKNIGIEIYSHREDDTNVNIIFNENEAIELYKNDMIVKLFYQNHTKYNCYSNNWAKSKGLDNYDDVCVVLNDNTAEFFDKGNLSKLPPLTKNKFYVACSRAKGNLFIIKEQHLKQFKAK